MLAPAVAKTVTDLIVPNRPVPLRQAAIGGVAAALLFEAMKRGCVRSIAKFPSSTLTCGAFAAVPIFLVWGYLCRG